MADNQILSARFMDMSGRIGVNTTVAATPSGSGETTIATITLPSGLTYNSGVYVSAGYNKLSTAGSTVTSLLNLKRGSTSLVTSGAVPVSASAVTPPLALDFIDLTPGDAPTYNLTLTLASAGGAASNLAVFISFVAI